MAIRRFSSRVSRGTRRPRRQLVWARQNNLGTPATLNANAPNVVDLLGDWDSATSAFMRGMTVMAIRGTVLIDPLAAVTLDWGACWAIGVRDRSQLSTGTTSLSPLQADRYGNWMAKGYFHRFTGTLGGYSVVDWKATEGNLEIKARRRLDEQNASLGLVTECIGGGAKMHYALDILLALP